MSWKYVVITYYRQQNGPPTIHTHSAEGKYLNLEQLGMVLQTLSHQLHGMHNVL